MKTLMITKVRSDGAVSVRHLECQMVDLGDYGELPDFIISTGSRHDKVGWNDDKKAALYRLEC